MEEIINIPIEKILCDIESRINTDSSDFCKILRMLGR
jgi:predicted site-specific integrase-resolvase